MHITPTSDDFREIAKHLCFPAKDLVPVPRRDLRWRILPEVLKEHPTFLDLIRTYNREKAPEIMKRARGRGRQLALKKGPEWYLVGSGLSAGPNELFVCIVLRNPLGQSIGDLGIPEATNETQRQVPRDQTPSDSLSKDQGAVRSHSTSQEDPFAEKRQIESQLGINAPASITSELKYSVGKGVETRPEPPALHVGDILEIHESETLEVRAGSIPMVWMGYTEGALAEEVQLDQ